MSEQFYCVYDWMTRDLGLHGSERDVFAVIYSFHGSVGAFTGGLQYLMRRTGATKPTVMESLRRLLAKELLIKKERFEKGVKLCEYRVNAARLPAGSAGQETLPGEGKEALPGEGKKPSRPGQESLPGAVKKSYPSGKETFPNNKEDSKIDNKEDNKEREAPAPVISRNTYGEYDNVLLSDGEMAALRREFPDDWRRRVDRLSEYMASTGKTYRNHLATIRAWARQDEPKKEKKSSYADLQGGLRL